MQTEAAYYDVIEDMTKKETNRNHVCEVEKTGLMTSPKKKSYLVTKFVYAHEPIKKWRDLYDIFCHDFPENNTDETWLFRGHNDPNEPLRTSLEKALCNIEGTDVKDEAALTKLLGSGLNGSSVRDIERGLIRRFKRQYYHFDVRIPDNDIEWLSLMRHYGAPIRMLNWSYSFFVAVFFAIEDSISKDGAAIWALEKNTIINSAKKVNNIGALLSEDEDIHSNDTWKGCFFSPGKPQLFVFPTNPFRLNERLVIQQGDLLCQGDISRTFEKNLAAMLPPGTTKVHSRLRKYTLKFEAKERQAALLALHRMNVSRASLFPGLEGFSKSLKTLLVSPRKLLYPGNPG